MGENYHTEEEDITHYHLPRISPVASTLISCLSWMGRGKGEDGSVRNCLPYRRIDFQSFSVANRSQPIMISFSVEGF